MAPRKALKAPPSGIMTVVEVDEPAVRNYEVKPHTPFVRHEKMSTRIKHRELLFEVIAVDQELDIGLLKRDVSVNPGMDSTYSWLAKMAKLFERYKFHSLKIHWVPSNATSTTPGQLYMCFNYENGDYYNLDTEQYARQISQTASACIAPIRLQNTISLDLELAQMTGPAKYIRTGNRLGKMIHDYCTFQQCITEYNSSNKKPEGSFWVEYDVTLIAPVGNVAASFLDPAVPTPDSCAAFEIVGNNYSLSPGFYEDVLMKREWLCNTLRVSSSLNTDDLRHSPWYIPDGDYVIEVTLNVTGDNVNPSTFTTNITTSGHGTGAYPMQYTQSFLPNEAQKVVHFSHFFHQIEDGIVNITFTGETIGSTVPMNLVVTTGQMIIRCV